MAVRAEFLESAAPYLRGEVAVISDDVFARLEKRAAVRRYIDKIVATSVPEVVKAPAASSDSTLFAGLKQKMLGK